MEIERKFLIRDIELSLGDYPVADIKQGYVVVSDEGEVRVRRKRDRYFLTIKRGSGLERNENEIEITPDQFERLYPAAGDQCLEKKRYEIPHGANIIELDVFSGKLNGLIIAEVEFKSPEDAAAFRAPYWFDREVTYDPRFSNRNLAKFGPPCE